MERMTTAAPPDPAPEVGRRSDGQETHQQILDAAMRLASIHGLGSLSFGQLADELGISKSGVFAHFRSKEHLQHETVEAARAVYAREVVTKGLEAAEGLPRLERLCEAYLSYIERGVFPGGCFFAHLLAEYDAPDGPIHDELAAGQQGWLSLLEEQIAVAKDEGQLDTGVDASQLAFELYAALELANYLSTLYRDTSFVDRGRAAVEGALRGASTTQR